MCDADDDDWATKAMEDSTLVANLLLRIKNQTSSSPSLNLTWTTRQPRSRTYRHAVSNKTEPTRASPTTPLSWTAATSPSDPPAAAASGSEESSRPTKSPHTSRSDNKVDEQNETATANKKSRKKRSLPELLEEEKLLLNERITLKNELASMHDTIEKQRAKNESLKRMKFDLVSEQTSKTVTTSPVSIKGKAVLDTPQLVEPHSNSSESLLPRQPVQEKVLDEEALFVEEKVLDEESLAASASSRQQETISKKEPKFLLPDLNLPAEEEEDFLI